MRLPLTLQFSVAVILLGSAPAASAQDAMQLDTAFRDSLLRKPASDGQTAYRQEQGGDVSKARVIDPRSARVRRPPPR